ncbi:MAG: acetate--CoA ligase family protein, partial [Deltaproteobacteria bacterium]|nr:acetate--CoA ligase family protein [Deltaproteobacteria bacterium]
MAEAELNFVLEPKGVDYLRSYAPYPEHELVQDADRAVEAADRLGYPVVLKIVSPDVPHKSDAGGVVAGLTTPGEVRRAYGQIEESVARNVPLATVEGMLVCRQEAEGLEVIVGGLEDPVFGPVVMFGLGGIYTEVFEDVVFGIAPLEKMDALEMLAQIKGRPLLTGVRGQPAKDTDSLAGLLVQASRLMTD